MLLEHTGARAAVTATCLDRCGFSSIRGICHANSTTRWSRKGTRASNPTPGAGVAAKLYDPHPSSSSAERREVIHFAVKTDHVPAADGPHRLLPFGRTDPQSTSGDAPARSRPQRPPRLRCRPGHGGAACSPSSMTAASSSFVPGPMRPIEEPADPTHCSAHSMTKAGNTQTNPTHTDEARQFMLVVVPVPLHKPLHPDLDGRYPA